MYHDISTDASIMNPVFSLGFKERIHVLLTQKLNDHNLPFSVPIRPSQPKESNINSLNKENMGNLFVVVYVSGQQIINRILCASLEQQQYD